jgi:centrosomal protein CEP104
MTDCPSCRERLPRATAAPLMDPILGLLSLSLLLSQLITPPLSHTDSLIEKLVDGASRIRDASQQSIEALAGCSSIGCGHVASHVLRALPAKQKTAWRPILGRIQILINLVKSYGVGGASGLDTQTILNFLKSLGAFAHSNGEVRDAAKALCVSIQKFVGDDPLLPFLTVELRKKQLEEYKAAFGGEEEGEEDGGGGAGPSQAQPQGHRVAESKMNRNVQTTAEKSFKKDDSKTATVDGGRGKGGAPGGKGGGGGAGEDYTICMFCGKQDPTWNEDGLDLHYWKECPLLSPCHACAQIVEIAGLPEHLLDECEHKNEFEACDTTGDSHPSPVPPSSSHLSLPSLCRSGDQEG